MSLVFPQDHNATEGTLESSGTIGDDHYQVRRACRIVYGTGILASKLSCFLGASWGKNNRLGTQDNQQIRDVELLDD